MRPRLLLVSLALLGFAASVGSAQTIVLNPTRVESTASADHAICVGGMALVDRYELRHYLVGATSPVQTQDLGKPTPDGTGKITAPVTALPLSQTIQYLAKVAAIGPTGVGTRRRVL